MNPQTQSNDEVVPVVTQRQSQWIGVSGDPQEQFLDRVDDVPFVSSMNAQ